MGKLTGVIGKVTYQLKKSPQPEQLPQYENNNALPLVLQMKRNDEQPVVKVVASNWELKEKIIAEEPPGMQLVPWSPGGKVCEVEIPVPDEDEAGTEGTEKKTAKERWGIAKKVVEDVKDEEGERRRRTKANWNLLLKEFSNSTSIHGLNRVMENSHASKRVFWLFLVITGWCLFGIQVVERGIYFAGHPVAVNVKVTFNDTLKFPAVTICNQNAFRLSAAVAAGYYDVINQAYSDNSSAALESDLAGNLSMLDLYTSTGHQVHDMILSCYWGSEQCGHEDFDVTLTDHGVCYTFNGAKAHMMTKQHVPDNNTSQQNLRYISQTGAENGLRLRINVEQYDYMGGPRDAAGLRLLLHEQHEVPLVGSMGEALPTGAHAFISVQQSKVNHLPPPHGNCSEGLELTYYKEYSVSNCYTECLTRYIIKQCACRDFYMPDMPDDPAPVCTMRAYHICTIPAKRQFYESDHVCHCPVPCVTTHHLTSISQATTSAHKTRQILRGDVMHGVQGQMANSREIAQRAQLENQMENRALVEELISAKQQVFDVLDSLPKYTDVVKRRSSTLWQRLKQRVKWHHVGLDRVQYAVDHDFARGWVFMDERTFIHVTTGFYQVSALYRRMLAVCENNATDPVQKEIWHVTTERDLSFKLELTKKSLENYTDFYHAYKNATPIYEFKGTLYYHYDDALIAKHLIKHNDENLEFYYGKFKGYLDSYIYHIDHLRQIADRVCHNGTYDPVDLENSIWHYEKRSRNFNYYRYFTWFRHIRVSVQMAADVIQDFQDVNQTFQLAKQEIDIAVDNLHYVVQNVRQSSLADISDTIHMAEQFLIDPMINKSHLTDAFTSENSLQSMRQVEMFFRDVRARVQQLIDSSSTLERAERSLWRAMVGDRCLVDFYEQVNSDLKLLYDSSHMIEKEVTTQETITDSRGTKTIEKFSEQDMTLREIMELGGLTLNSAQQEIVEVLCQLLKTDQDSFLELTHQQLTEMVNADMMGGGDDIDGVLAAIEEVGDTKKDNEEREIEDQEREMLLVELGRIGDRLQKALEAMSDNLHQFRASTMLDTTFVQENFLQINIFTRELSYEEFEQNVAYDIVGLLSDIGGSLGLFVGASMLSMFELLDLMFDKYKHKIT